MRVTTDATECGLAYMRGARLAQTAAPKLEVFMIFHGFMEALSVDILWAPKLVWRTGSKNIHQQICFVALGILLITPVRSLSGHDWPHAAAQEKSELATQR